MLSVLGPPSPSRLFSSFHTSFQCTEADSDTSEHHVRPLKRGQWGLTRVTSHDCAADQPQYDYKVLNFLLDSLPR